MSAAMRADVFPLAAPSMKTQKEEPPMTVEEFCRRYFMSRASFYRLRKKGRTPAEMRVTRKILITAASAREWERRMVREKAAMQRAARNR